MDFATALPTAAQPTTPAPLALPLGSSVSVASKAVSDVVPVKAAVGAGGSPPPALGSTLPAIPIPQPTALSPSVSPAARYTDDAAVASASPLPVPRATLQRPADADDAGHNPFSVAPAAGEVAAGATAEILVKFAPLDVAEYFAFLFAKY